MSLAPKWAKDAAVLGLEMQLKMLELQLEIAAVHDPDTVMKFLKAIDEIKEMKS